MRLAWEWTIGRRWLSCSAQIIPRIIPVTPLNTEQHYSAEGNDDEKDKNNVDPWKVISKVNVHSLLDEIFSIHVSKYFYALMGILFSLMIDPKL